jgi:hypothetical protein
MISIREPISSHAEHAWKCLKVEYLGRIKNDFQKSRVTDPWDHKVQISAKKYLKKFHACVPLNICLFLLFLFRIYICFRGNVIINSYVNLPIPPENILFFWHFYIQ